MREAVSSIAYEFRWLAADTWMLAWRMLMHYRRTPEMLASAVFSPIMFLVMFNYVFGGAIGGSAEFAYIDYLVPGVLIQNNVFTVMQTGVGLADDLQKGVIDRYRSLPMARSAVLAGRVTATTMVSLLTVFWTIGIAMIIGMRFHGGLWPALCLPFVPVETMPGWLQAFAEINPITQVVNLCRNLAQGGPIASYALPTALWIVVMVFGIGSLATWRYKRIS